MAERVGAVAEDENREIVRAGEVVGCGDVVGFFNLDDVSRGATKPHGSKTRNQNVFIDAHTVIILYL